MINNIINKIGKVSPSKVSRLFVNVPFEYRYGKVYSRCKNKIKESENWDEKTIENYIVSNFDKIFQHSKNFRFYHEKFKRKGVLNLKVKSIDDIKRIPILYKREIRDNITEFDGYYSQKTGGTTGNPLSLYLDKNAWAREWAHFHYIWSKAEYRYTNAVVTFRDLDSKNEFIKYNFRHNEFIINIYKIYIMTSSEIDEFLEIIKTFNVRYFKGYPSAINDFLREFKNKTSVNQKNILKEQIDCCFYGSEYPTHHIVDYLKKEWGIDFISWYGHSEACVLAASRKNKLDYYPMYTYGYAEVEGNMLLGTSYHNFDMPLIRYNTEDLVKPRRYANGILRSFKIKEGRVGDIIMDKNNLWIHLTGLVNRVNPEIFNYIDYIQVFQEKIGYATILISQNKSNENKLGQIEILRLMNVDNIEVKFDIIYIEKPIRSKSGKFILKVHKLP